MADQRWDSSSPATVLASFEEKLRRDNYRQKPDDPCVRFLWSELEDVLQVLRDVVVGSALSEGEG
jgi:hypothetical protein